MTDNYLSSDIAPWFVALNYWNRREFRDRVI
jgi:hypothetical protein